MLVKVEAMPMEVSRRRAVELGEVGEYLNAIYQRLAVNVWRWLPIDDSLQRHGDDLGNAMRQR